MSEHLLLAAWLLFAIYFITRHIYRKAVSPYLLDRERFTVFSLRDQLRRIIDKEGQHSFSHIYLERVFNQGIQGIGTISLTGLFFYLIEHVGEDGKIRSSSDADYERFQREASPALKQLSADFSGALLAAMCINSPILTTACWLTAKSIGLVRPSGNPMSHMKQTGEKVLYTHREILCPSA